MVKNVKYALVHLLSFAGRLAQREDLRKQKYARLVLNLRMCARLAYSIYNMDCQWKFVIDF